MNDKSNPLLDVNQLPEFSAIRPAHVNPAIDQVLARNRDLIEKLQANAGRATWENFVQPMEDMEDYLSKVWSPVSHLNAVKDSDDLRREYEVCLPKLAAYSTEIGQNMSTEVEQRTATLDTVGLSAGRSDACSRCGKKIDKNVPRFPYCSGQLLSFD